MSTFGALTDSTLRYLHGFTTSQEDETYLTSSLSSSGLTLNVGDATALSRGVVEIDDELIRVDSVDEQSLAATIPPYGRGYKGTTAASHATNSRITIAPLFPRVDVKNAINQSIQSVFPIVSAVAETTFTYSPAISTYALPAGAQSILTVTWKTVGPSKEWYPVRRWRIDSAADTTAFPTGATVSVYDQITPGRTVKVVYMKPPSPLTAESDPFTNSGLPATAEDLIRLGAAMRLITFLDSPHLSGMSAEADFSANQRPVGGSAQLARSLMQQYQIRLSEEAARQQSLYPVRAHYTR